MFLLHVFLRFRKLYFSLFCQLYFWTFNKSKCRLGRRMGNKISRITHWHHYRPQLFAKILVLSKTQSSSSTHSHQYLEYSECYCTYYMDELELGEYDWSHHITGDNVHHHHHPFYFYPMIKHDFIMNLWSSQSCVLVTNIAITLAVFVTIIFVILNS